MEPLAQPSYDVVASIVTHHSPLAQVSEAVKSFSSANLSLYLQILDNASAADYVQSLRDVSCDALIEHPHNHGFGAGHNAALKLAPASRYYLIMNPDVVVHPATLEKMVEILDSDPSIGAVVPKVLSPDGALQPLCKREPRLRDFFIRRFVPSTWQAWPVFARSINWYEMQDTGYDKPMDVPFISGCFMLWRRELLEQLGGFDERFFLYMEDCDLSRRARQITRLHYLPEAIITHHWARGAHKNRRLMWVMMQSIFRYYQKWGWRL